MPAPTLYISLATLKGVQFENELAAAIALEFAHLELRHFFSGLEESESLLEPRFRDYLKNGFRFELMEAAIPYAVQLLYDANYDPRGMANWWEYQSRHLGQTQMTKEQVRKGIDTAYRAISRQSPLMSPIVQSPEFEKLKSRVRNL